MEHLGSSGTIDEGTATSWPNIIGNGANFQKTRHTSSSSGSVPLIASSNLLLRSLPPQLFETIRPALRTVRLTNEQYLFHQGDEVNYVYFPETVVLSEFRILVDGRTVEVAIAGREGASGLSTLYCPTGVANCTQVVHEGSATRILTEVLMKLAKTHTELPLYLNHYLNTYIQQISQKAICNMYHSVEERLCTWLLMLADRCGKQKLRVTHEQISRSMGVHRPSVSRIAKILKRRFLIDYSRGGILICSRQRMEESACGCYTELGTGTELAYNGMSRSATAAKCG